MQETANPSLREFKRETEQTRAGLTQTVEQLKATVSETASDLRQRISPEAIKAEVSDYGQKRRILMPCACEAWPRAVNVKKSWRPILQFICPRCHFVVAAATMDETHSFPTKITFVQWATEMADTLESEELIPNHCFI
jgi:hypothetical protein